VEAVVNTGATLFCESLGLPDPVVTWEKDGKPFPTTGLRHRMRVSGTIEFTSVRLEDTGTYTCNATNKAGTAARVIKLDVQGIHVFLDVCFLLKNKKQFHVLLVSCNTSQRKYYCYNSL
jgi:hypothetical protein